LRLVKILVPVKQVARLREDFDADRARTGVGAVELAADALEWAPNECDAFSLEAALALSEGGEGETVVVTVGDERAEESLRAGLAMGADRAVRVWDEALAGADALAIARVLAAVAGAERPDLILCGAQSSDAASAATGVALAGLLDVAHVAVVEQIERDGERLTVQRQLEGGAVELLSVALPTLLTVQSGINAPRRPNLRAIKQARAASVTVLGLADVGLDVGAVAAAAGSRTVGLTPRPRGGGAKLIDGPPAAIAARIAEIVGEAMRA
jgi:electron transfer flavoprotein beta subunit